MFGKKRAAQEKANAVNSAAEDKIRAMMGSPADVERAKELSSDPLIGAIGEHNKETARLIRTILANPKALSTNAIGLIMAINSAKLTEAIEKATGYKVGGKKSGNRRNSRSARKSPSSTSN